MSRTLVRTVGGALACAVAAMAAIAAAGWSPRVEYVLALAAIGAAATVALRRLLAAVAPPAWPAPAPVPRPVPGVDPRAGTIETSLRRGLEDAGICRRRVQPLLFDLATHRLRRRRGVALLEQPDEARALLGDDAFAFLTEVVERPAPPATILRTVEAVERL